MGQSQIFYSLGSKCQDPSTTLTNSSPLVSHTLLVCLLAHRVLFSYPAASSLCQRFVHLPICFPLSLLYDCTSILIQFVAACFMSTRKLLNLFPHGKVSSRCSYCRLSSSSSRCQGNLSVAPHSLSHHPHRRSRGRSILLSLPYHLQPPYN